ncbi:RNA binding protein, heterogenous nuclear RNP-K like protein [Cladochytrium tenue]|nr:RNA binding protein, heterogenous nuclear RNP-K like protein [Cladochytrium tenue]
MIAQDEPFGYSSQIARLTGLTLDPEAPPQQPHLHQNFPTHMDPSAAILASNGHHLHDVDGVHGLSPSPGHDVDGDSVSGGPEPAAAAGEPVITIRSLVSTKEAGVIIGKGGKNVAEVRQETGVKAGVSKVVAGVHERVLTVSGTTLNVAKAYSMMAQFLLENPVSAQPVQQYADCTTIRLLVSHQLVGSIIGKGGAKIKEIQEESGAKLVISKEMLPQSTERVIDVFGLIESIKMAVLSIAECILADQERAAGTILYNPQVRLNSPEYRNGGPSSVPRTGRFDDPARQQPRRWDGGNSFPSNSGRRFPRDGAGPSGNGSSSPTGGPTANGAGGDVQTQTLAVPIDMVGCIIGKGGSFITAIRRHSNARLHIAEPENGSSDRIVTITGSGPANAKALQMIYDQLEAEKIRRLNGGNDAEE